MFWQIMKLVLTSPDDMCVHKCIHMPPEESKRFQYVLDALHTFSPAPTSKSVQANTSSHTHVCISICIHAHMEIYIYIYTHQCINLSIDITSLSWRACICWPAFAASGYFATSLFANAQVTHPQRARTLQLRSARYFQIACGKSP